MGIPTGIGIIDTMMGTRAGQVAKEQNYAPLRKGQLKDADSQTMNFPAQYMFKDVPWSNQSRGASGPVEEPPQGADLLLPLMDKWGIERSMVGVSPINEIAQQAIKAHPERFIPSFEIDPNKGMDGIREMVQMYEVWGIRAITAFPAGYFPQVPINDKKMYPFYAKCCELDIPIFCCAGIPGPRVPFRPQHVELIDEVMYDFPELTFVTRHGCEPWTALAVKLMLKWPGLHYSTSAFAPKHYPKDIIDYANTRGADKVIYAGYFPMGLHLERIMTDMQNVPFKDEVWPKFLRDNARRVLKLS
jgi:predicted TIM-barrel fold metal-dependent hydrolase